MKKKPVTDFGTFASLYNKPFQKKIKLYDSTLRDGEQMPGVAFSMEQKLEIASKLDDIRVPQIEAGFPVVSDQEMNTVKKIGSLGLDAEILALSRVSKKDIDAVISCDVDMILLFVATSDLHLDEKLRCDYSSVKERSIEAIDYAMDHGFRVSFSSEDSTRTHPGRLTDLLGKAVEMGVDKIGVTDTVGGGSPEAISGIVNTIRNEISETIPISVHLHNDFGMGIANAVAGVKSGANSVAVTVNGIGERAGNVPLEGFVMAMKILYENDLGIDTTGFQSVSEMVSEYSGVPIHTNSPHVGANAFSHESGIHVAALLKNAATYEVYPPETVGNIRHLGLGKHTGSTFVRRLLKDKGIQCNEEIVSEILNRVKELPEVSREKFWEIVNGIMPKDDSKSD